jgi:hypothetical protein
VNKAARSAHTLLILLNVPVALIAVYLFIYAFIGLWHPTVAAQWWWLAVLGLPITAAAFWASHRLWRTGAYALSNTIAGLPVLACSPILYWIIYGAWHQ